MFSQAHFKSIQHLCSTWTNESGHELEANFTDRIYRFQFRKCMASLMKMWGRVKEDVEVMDVSVVTEKTYRGPQIRYSVVGKKDIAAYCKTNKLVGIEFSQFKHRLGVCDAGADFGIKIKLSKENMERVSPNVNSEIHDSLKLFRLKKRYSVMAGDSGFRVDFTIVKSARAKNLAAAQLYQEPEKFEVEIEYIGSDQPDAHKFVDVIETVVAALRDDMHLVSSHEKERVLEFYMAMVSNNGNNRPTFIGPKPVTLEHKHLLSMGPCITGGDYSVTEKADGDRALLVIDASGAAFLLNNRFNVKATNMHSKVKSSIMDVEVVTRPNGSKLVLVFDCYWANEKPTWTMDLSERLKAVAGIIKAMSTTKSKYEIRSKTFYMDADILAATERLLAKIERSEFDYVTDGVIYTPIKAAVGETEIKSATLGGTWTSVFKWKEPRDNTIDVMVEVAAGQNAAGFRSFNIFVRSAKATVETYFELASNIKPTAGFVKYRFVPRGAPDTMDVPVDDSGICKCANGDEIREKYIVEVSFDATTKMWKPLRIRHDKIEEARQTGTITANALNPTASSVWRTISNPVTFKQITGKEPVSAENMLPDDIDDDGEYYKGHGADRKKEIFALREFHNYWVKGVSLLGRFTDRATKLFDVSCGQGGDINRWFKYRFTTVVGVDKAEGGIISEDGAYQRLIKKTEIRPPAFNYVFVPMDSGRIWTQQIDEIKDEYMKKLARVAWGLDPSPLQSIKHLEGIAAAPTFDLVSCQFSLHYFFETEAMLDGLISNINSVLAPGGHFVGTCFDGEKVANLLGQSTERKGRDGMWEIRKAWTSNTYKKTFGQAIDVYVESIDKWHREYLVPYDLLVKRLAKVNIRPLTPAESTALGFGGVSMGSFEDLYEAMKDSGDTSVHVKNALRMDHNVDERTLSFLNMWFVFIKDFKKPNRRSNKALALAAEVAASAAASK